MPLTQAVTQKDSGIAGLHCHPLFHLCHLVAVDGAVVLADVQADSPYGALVSGEAHGIILLDDLVNGLLSGLAILQLDDVYGVGQSQDDVHTTVRGLVLRADVGTIAHQGRIDERLVELLVLVSVGDTVGNAGIPAAHGINELLNGGTVELEVEESVA